MVGVQRMYKWLVVALIVLSTPCSCLAQLWQQTNGPGGDDILSLAVNKQGDVFAVSRGLNRSTDGGLTWAKLINTASPIHISKVYITRSGRVMVTTADDLQDHRPVNVVYASDDNGDHWKQLAQMVDKLWQGADGKLFTRAKEYGPFKPGEERPDLIISSDDEGETWDTVTLKGIEENIITFSSSQNGLLVAVTDQYMYRSDDNGITWSKVLNGLTSVDNTGGAIIYWAPNGDAYFFTYYDKQLFKSSDQGRTWQALPLKNITELAIAPNGFLYAQNNNNVFLSKDNGNLWQETVLYVDNILAWPMAVDNFNNLYLGNPGQLFYFNPFSLRVEPVKVTNGSIGALLSHPSGLIVALTYSANQNVWFSSDRGDSWFTKGTFLSHNGILSLDSSGNLLSNSRGEVIISKDTAKTWQSFSPLLTTEVISAIAVRVDGSIFASVASEGIFRTTDQGITWDQINKGITDTRIFSLSMYPTGQIFAGGINAIYRSDNGGQSWVALPTTFPKGSGGVTSLNVNTQGNIIARVDNAGVYWSVDTGKTWSPHGVGLDSVKIYNLVSTPSGKMFAGTSNGVFFLDTITGSPWVPYTSGITSPTVISLCRDQLGRIYAGTDGGSVYRSFQQFNVAPSSKAGCTLSLSNIQFPVIRAGSFFDTTITIQSSGKGPITITSIEYSSAQGHSQDYEIKQNSLFPLTLQPSESRTVTLSFTPKQRGACSGNLLVVSNSLRGIDTIRLRGNSKQGELSTTINSLYFPVVSNELPVDSTIRVTNTGDADIQITEIHVTGDQSFSSIGLQLPATIYPGDSRNIPVTFRAKANGLKDAVMWIVNNGAHDSIPVVLHAEVKNFAEVRPGMPSSFNMAPIVPNPASSVITVPLSVSETSAITIGMIDELGRSVIAYPAQYYETGEHRIAVDISHCAAGVYRLVAASSKGNRTEQVVIQR